MKITETDLQKTQMLGRSEDFKMLFINTLNDIMQKIYLRREQMGNVIRDMKTIKKKKPNCLKKNSLDGLNNRLEPMGEKNSKSEDRLIKS